jgi:hypothetical protein
LHTIAADALVANMTTPSTAEAAAIAIFFIANLLFE